MPDFQNSSFIPKRGPVKRRHGGGRKVYVFTLISYATLFATLLAVAAVFFYGKYIEKQLSDAVTQLNTEIASFSEEDMLKVQDFDRRLQQGARRLDASVSVNSVLTALEEATVSSVQIDTLSIERQRDSQLLIAANVRTGSFDSTLFQRGIFQRNQTVGSVTIKELETQNLGGGSIQRSDAEAEREGSIIPLVKFIAELEVPISEIPYVPATAVPSRSATPVTAVPTPIEITEESVDVTDVSVNQNEL